MLLGTFWVWLILGLAEFDGDVPGWIAPTAVALGLITAAVTVAVTVATFRKRPRARLMAVAVGFHLGLAIATAVALGSILGTTVLLAGAGAVWMSGTVRPAPAQHR